MEILLRSYLLRENFIEHTLLDIPITPFLFSITFIHSLTTTQYRLEILLLFVILTPQSSTMVESQNLEQYQTYN